MKPAVLLLSLVLLGIGIFSFTQKIGNSYARENTPLETRNLSLFDKSRSRKIPTELYESSNKEGKATNTKRPLIIISHGKTVKNTEYTFLARAFAARGCLVASIQHEFLTDAPLIAVGSLYERRKPIWEQGVKNILFVLEELKKTESNLDFEKVTLIGHSKGGDISILFATNHPDKVMTVVSLDSLRMPFPRTQVPRIISLRANGTKADDGVLPTQAEQEKLGIRIVNMPDAKHMDFCDRGLAEMKQKINEIVLTYVK
jgi:predicted esterase